MLHAYREEQGLCPHVKNPAFYAGMVFFVSGGLKIFLTTYSLLGQSETKGGILWQKKGEIAQMIAKRRGFERMSAQAVGGAVGHNEISVIVPCHRVVGSSGSLTGYAGGIEKKIRLLTLEGVDMSGLYVPKKGTAL